MAARSFGRYTATATNGMVTAGWTGFANYADLQIPWTATISIFFVEDRLSRSQGVDRPGWHMLSLRLKQKSGQIARRRHFVETS
jgi:hypothetical protein